MSVFEHLFLWLTEYLREPTQMLSFMLIPHLGILLYQLMPLLRSVFGSFARKHSFLNLDLSLAPHLFLPLLSDIKQLKWIVDKVFLNHLIKWRVSGKWRGIVDFQYLGVKFMVQNHIKPKNLKAHVIGKVLRMTALLKSTQVWIPCDNGLDQHIVDSLLDLFTVVAQLVQSLINWREGSFVAFVALCGLLVEDKVGVELVNCVVCQVHVLIV